MKRRKTTEIVVEREQILVIRKLDHREPQGCLQCGGDAQMVRVDEAVSIVRLTARAIFKRVESQQTHFLETPDGQLLVCLNSLLQYRQE
jgi:hypothetical protein